MHGRGGSVGGLFRGYAPSKCGGHLRSLRVQLGCAGMGSGHSGLSRGPVFRGSVLVVFKPNECRLSERKCLDRCMGIRNPGRPNHRHTHAIQCGEMERGLCHSHRGSVVVECSERGHLWKRFHRYSSRGRTDAAILPSGCGPLGGDERDRLAGAEP